MGDEPRLLCDGMLGSLARWLRLVGFDTAYAASTLSDDEVLALCGREGRLLVTRDVSLHQRGLRMGLSCQVLDDESVLDQVQVLVRRGALRLDPARFFSRCTRCNGGLEKETPAAVRGSVPPAVFDQHEEFWRCASCGHIYWKGTHVEEIHRRLAGLQEG